MTEKKHSVSTVEISEHFSDQRLDNFLFNTLKDIPKTHVYRIIRTGQVRLNKKRVKPSYKLQAGDLIRIPPLYREETDPNAKPLPPKPLGRKLLEHIVYEDDYLIILNKPAGIAVHGGSGVQFGVIETLRAHHPRGEQLELVHRLDRETSGCLMVAKKRSALRGIHALLQSGEGIQKKYQCLVRGAWPGAHTVQEPLLKNTLKSGERVVRVSSEGQTATTQFKRLKAYAHASLMEARPITGRTHQIRVHATHAGHPIAGDEKYGDSAFNKDMKRSGGLNRLFLHAYELILTLPYNGQELSVSSPLDSSLTQVLKQLQETPHE